MDRDFYNKQGYYISKQLLPSAAIEEILSDIEMLLKNYFQQRLNVLPTQQCLYSLLKTLFEQDPVAYGEFVKMTGVISRLPSIQLLQFHPTLLQSLQDLNIQKFLIPTGPIVNIFAADMCTNNNFLGLEAHQDWPSMQGSLDAVIAWIPLSNIHLDTNPLEIVPQSHKAGLLAQAVTSHHYHTVDHYGGSEFYPLEVEMGDVVFMSAFTVHRTGKQGRPDSLRAALSFRYDNAEDPFFVSRLYPTAYRRSVDRELKADHIPTCEQVRSVFV